MPNPIIWLIFNVISLYSMILFAWIITSLLIQFGVVNRYHPIVGKLFEILEQLVNPALKYIRRYVPPMGSIDIAPIILILGLQFLQYCISYYTRPTIFM